MRREIGDYRIVETGRNEGTPASGAADLIVDITTTGATLAANGLKVLDDGVILRSEANLIASRQIEMAPQLPAPPPPILAQLRSEDQADYARIGIQPSAPLHRPTGSALNRQSRGP